MHLASPLTAQNVELSGGTAKALPILGPLQSFSYLYEGSVPSARTHCWAAHSSLSTAVIWSVTTARDASGTEPPYHEFARSHSWALLSAPPSWGLLNDWL
jgi:hypothetical protein